eukprot:72178_1
MATILEMQQLWQRKEVKIAVLTVAAVTFFIALKNLNKNKYIYMEKIFGFMVKMGENRPNNSRFNTDKNIESVKQMETVTNTSKNQRIIRFISDESSDKINYGILCENAQPKPGGFARIISTNNIYDTSSWIVNKSKSKIHTLLSPIDTHTIYGIGLNYKGHAKKSWADMPRYPITFMKPNTSVIASFEDIIIPKCHLNDLDYEVELVIIIGKQCKNISAKNALEYVFGFSIGNDVSCRMWQLMRGGGQWSHGKGFDTFCPFGPCILINDGKINANNLHLWCRVNGKIVQFSNTNDLIFDIGQIVSFLSTDCTLQPGTIILS